MSTRVLIDHRKGGASKIRHPEKAHRPDNPIARKPEWIRVKAPTHPVYHETRKLMRDNRLVTVCEEAACPNIGECWSQRHATMMIMGEICTRACSFCNVTTGLPHALDEDEPARVAEAVAKLGLRHVVITSVDRDDLEDGGARHFARVIASIRDVSPETTIEILTPDFLRKNNALEIVVEARPDVFNHNLETVPRLYPSIRPGARYYQSMRLLDRVKQLDASIFTKSGLMLGLGEEKMEIAQVMDDLRIADVDFITMGQYLQPTVKHAAVARFVTPTEFEEYGAMARVKGFLQVSSSPLTRSSYHADADFAELQQTRNARLAGGELMPKHAEKRVLAYRADQIFDLVADVGHYPEFLPWCVAARVRTRTATELVADLTVGFGPFRESFTSRVTLNRPDSITVQYERGPFRYLKNLWKFTPDSQGCVVEFFVDFEFRSRILQAAIGVVFGEAVRLMVSAFLRRAREVYGPPETAASLSKEHPVAQ